LLYTITLSPEVAAMAMSGSSALVAINALMLKRTRLGAKTVSTTQDVLIPVAA
jgi:Cu2+-exporting ATPase